MSIFKRKIKEQKADTPPSVGIFKVSGIAERNSSTSFPADTTLGSRNGFPELVTSFDFGIGPSSTDIASGGKTSGFSSHGNNRLERPKAAQESEGFKSANTAAVLAMSEEEVEASLAELRQHFSQGALDFLKKRGEREIADLLGTNCNEVNVTPPPQTCVSAIVSDTNQTEVTKAAVAWMDHNYESKSTETPLLGNKLKVVERFDLEGKKLYKISDFSKEFVQIFQKDSLFRHFFGSSNDHVFLELLLSAAHDFFNGSKDFGIVSELAILEDTAEGAESARELFHHEFEHSRPGYSLREACEWVRSEVPSQVSFGLRLLSGSLRRRELIASMEAYAGARGAACAEGDEDKEREADLFFSHRIEDMLQDFTKRVLTIACRQSGSIDTSVSSKEGQPFSSKMIQYPDLIAVRVRRLVFFVLFDLVASDFPTELAYVVQFVIESKPNSARNKLLRLKLLKDYLCSEYEEEAARYLWWSNTWSLYGCPLYMMPHARRTELTYGQSIINCASKRKASENDIIQDSNATDTRPRYSIVDRCALLCRWSRMRTMFGEPAYRGISNALFQNIYAVFECCSQINRGVSDKKDEIKALLSSNFVTWICVLEEGIISAEILVGAARSSLYDLPKQKVLQSPLVTQFFDAWSQALNTVMIIFPIKDYRRCFDICDQEHTAASEKLVSLVYKFVGEWWHFVEEMVRLVGPMHSRLNLRDTDGKDLLLRRSFSVLACYLRELSSSDPETIEVEAVLWATRTWRLCIAAGRGLDFVVDLLESSFFLKVKDGGSIEATVVVSELSPFILILSRGKMHSTDTCMVQALGVDHVIFEVIALLEQTAKAVSAMSGIIYGFEDAISCGLQCLRKICKTDPCALGSADTKAPKINTSVVDALKAGVCLLKIGEQLILLSDSIDRNVPNKTYSEIEKKRTKFCIFDSFPAIDLTTSVQSFLSALVSVSIETYDCSGHEEEHSGSRNELWIEMLRNISTMHIGWRPVVNPTAVDKHVHESAGGEVISKVADLQSKAMSFLMNIAVSRQIRHAILNVSGLVESIEESTKTLCYLSPIVTLHAERLFQLDNLLSSVRYLRSLIEIAMKFQRELLKEVDWIIISSRILSLLKALLLEKFELFSADAENIDFLGSLRPQRNTYSGAVHQGLIMWKMRLLRQLLLIDVMALTSVTLKCADQRSKDFPKLLQLLMFCCVKMVPQISGQLKLVSIDLSIVLFEYLVHKSSSAEFDERIKKIDCNSEIKAIHVVLASNTILSERRKQSSDKFFGAETLSFFELMHSATYGKPLASESFCGWVNGSYLFDVPQSKEGPNASPPWMYEIMKKLSGTDLTTWIKAVCHFLKDGWSHAALLNQQKEKEWKYDTHVDGSCRDDAGVVVYTLLELALPGFSHNWVDELESKFDEGLDAAAIDYVDLLQYQILNISSFTFSDTVITGSQILRMCSDKFPVSSQASKPGQELIESMLQFSEKLIEALFGETANRNIPASAIAMLMLPSCKLPYQINELIWSILGKERLLHILAESPLFYSCGIMFVPKSTDQHNFHVIDAIKIAIGNLRNPVDDIQLPLCLLGILHIGSYVFCHDGEVSENGAAMLLELILPTSKGGKENYYGTSMFCILLNTAVNLLKIRQLHKQFSESEKDPDILRVYSMQLFDLILYQSSFAQKKSILEFCAEKYIEISVKLRTKYKLGERTRFSLNELFGIFRPEVLSEFLVDY